MPRAAGETPTVSIPQKHHLALERTPAVNLNTQTEMALIFWVIDVRQTGHRLNLDAHSRQQQWCPHGTSVQVTAESKHTFHRKSRGEREGGGRACR